MTTGSLASRSSTRRRRHSRQSVSRSFPPRRHGVEPGTLPEPRGAAPARRGVPHQQQAMRSPNSGGGSRGREAVAGDDAVVVEPHQLDHVADVLIIVDPPCRHRVLSGEDRVVDDTALLAQGGPDLLAEAEVGGMVTVQMADLMAVDPEAPLAPLAVTGLDPGPRGDLVGDRLAR